MQDSDDNLTIVKLIDFGCIPVDTVMEKCFTVENTFGVSKKYTTMLE